MKRKKQILSLILTSFMILSVVATCGSATIDSLASSVPFSIADEYGLTSSDILSASGFSSADIDLSSADLTNFVPNKSYSNLYDYSARIAECLPDIQFENTSLNYDAPLFFSVTQQNQMLTTYVLPQGSIINTYGYQFDVFIPHEQNITTLYCSTWNCYSNIFDSNSSASSDGTVEIDGVIYDYYEWGFTANWTYCYLTNCPIYSVYNIINTRSFGDNQLNYTDTYNNAATVGQTSTNNLVMEDSDFIFKHSDYYAPYSDVINTGSVYPNGNIKFTFTPNEYQTLHPNEFTVTFSFTFDYDVNYKYSATNDTPPFYKNGISNKWKNCSIRFIYSNNGSEYIDVPLSQFISSGDSYSISFEDVMSNMQGSGYSFASVLATSKEVTSLQYNKFNVNCTAFISSGTKSSGNYSEWYNPINKKGYTTDKSAQTNTNPYYSSDSEYDDSYDDLFTPGTAGTGGDNANNVGGGNSSSSSNSTGGSASATTGNITINNTNNNNNSNSLASDGSSGFGKFLTTILELLSDGQEASSDTIMDMTDANGFMDVANTTLSTVPSSLWTVLLTTFSVCIAISIVAIVIGLLLKIFT